MDLKPTERMALVRAEAVAALPALADATQVGTATFIMATENGNARVTVTAIKDENFDVEAERDAYVAALAAAEAKAQARAEAKAAKEAEKAAKKAAKEAEKAE